MEELTVDPPRADGASADRQCSIAVILLTLDQRDKTLRCLQSFQQVFEPTHRIVVWDNGSRDGTIAAVQTRFPAVVAHYHPANLGVASGRNAAADLARHELDPEFLLFLDNDTEVTPDLLTELRRPLLEDESIAQTTGKILTLGDPYRIYGAGGCYLKLWSGRTGHVGHGESDHGQHDRSTECLPSGGCMLVPTRIFQELAGFDPSFDPYGPEDLDFGLRARNAGYRSLYVPSAVLLHESSPGHTFAGGMRSTLYVENKTRLWFRLMTRHATIWQWLAFLSVGAPLGLIRMLWREARRGNLAAMAGLLSGAWDQIRPGRRQEKP